MNWSYSANSYDALTAARLFDVCSCILFRLLLLLLILCFSDAFYPLKSLHCSMWFWRVCFIFFLGYVLCGAGGVKTRFVDKWGMGQRWRSSLFPLPYNIWVLTWSNGSSETFWLTVPRFRPLYLVFTLGLTGIKWSRYSSFLPHLNRIVGFVTQFFVVQVVQRGQLTFCGHVEPHHLPFLVLGYLSVPVAVHSLLLIWNSLKVKHGLNFSLFRR